MKRILSICLVFVVLLSLSVTTFASDVYIPKTVKLVYDSDTLTYKVPDGVDIYVGDTITFNPFIVNFKEKLGAPDFVSSVYPSNIGIYVNGIETAKIWYKSSVTFNDLKFAESGYCYFVPNCSLEVPGRVVFKIYTYHIEYSSSRQENEFYSVSGPFPNLISFELKDPCLAPAEVQYRGIFQSIMTMVSELVKMIVSYPLILVFVVLSLVGLGIGIFCRVKK